MPFLHSVLEFGSRGSASYMLVRSVMYFFTCPVPALSCGHLSCSQSQRHKIVLLFLLLVLPFFLFSCYGLGSFACFNSELTSESKIFFQ
jgi:hypothetical protein